MINHSQSYIYVIFIEDSLKFAYKIFRRCFVSIKIHTANFWCFDTNFEKNNP